MASKQGGGDLRGMFAERLECARERPLSFATLRTSLTAKYGQFRPLSSFHKRAVAWLESRSILLASKYLSKWRVVVRPVACREDSEGNKGEVGAASADLLFVDSSDIMGWVFECAAA